MAELPFQRLVEEDEAMSKVADEKWGDEHAYFSQPAMNVPADASWLSVVGFYLFLPLNLGMALLTTFLDPMFRWVASLAQFSTMHGRPLWMCWAWWWYQVAGALQLIARSGGSRFTLFSRSRAIFGGGDWWWHGEGAWSCPYAGVRATMASEQQRRPAFGAVATAVPELFPAEILLFLDGPKWKASRQVLVDTLTAPSNWASRVAALPDVLAAFKPTPCSLATLDKPTSDRMVAAAVWFLLFGVQLTPEQATTVAQWGASGMAGYFVFPRLIHRIAFNLLLKKVTTLRKDTLAVFTAHGLRPLAGKMNDALGPHRRPSSLALADELMYAVNFAGVGGTQHACWGTLQFLQRKTVDVKQAAVVFPPEIVSLVEMYVAHPDHFITECVRLDAPVTSATCAFASTTTVAYNNACCGAPAEHSLPAGTLHQYVLSIANRDPAHFDKADVFDPSRSNLKDMIGWNGALSKPADYPRICPGQAMSVAIIQAVVGLAEEVQQVGRSA